MIRMSRRVLKKRLRRIKEYDPVTDSVVVHRCAWDKNKRPLRIANHDIYENGLSTFLRFQVQLPDEAK